MQTSLSASQTGKYMKRAMFNCSLSEAAEILQSLRAAGSLDTQLIHNDMTTAKRSAEDDKHSGINLRRYLLAELLLTGTPLEFIMNPDATSDVLRSAVFAVPGGGPMLHHNLKLAGW